MLATPAIGLMMLGTEGCAGNSDADNAGGGWRYGEPDGGVVLDRFEQVARLLTYRDDPSPRLSARSHTDALRTAESELLAGRSAANSPPASTRAAS